MIPKGKGLPQFADDATLNQIRGKAMVGHQTIEDVWTKQHCGKAWKDDGGAE